jgi:hypothetical protein
MAHGGECSDGKGNLLFCANDVRQMMCTIIVRDTIYKSWFMKKLIVRWSYFTPPPHLAGCDAAVNIICSPRIPEAVNYHLKKNHRDASDYMFTDNCSNMVNTCRKHGQCFICKMILFDENWLEAHYQQYHPISMNEGLMPDRILAPAGWDRPESLWFDFSRGTWMALDEFCELIHLPIDNVPGAPPPEDTPHKEPMDPLKPDLTCTPDPR